MEMQQGIMTSTMQRDPPDRHRGVWPVALVIVSGLTLGVATQLLQGHLNLGWNVVANSGAVWLTVAFLVGAAIRVGIVGSFASGLGTLVLALSGYYVAAGLFEGEPPALSTAALWAVIALIGGPVYGMAGSWWRVADRWRHIVALVLLGGVLVGEGLHLLVHVKTQGAAGWVEIFVGVCVPVALARSTGDRLRGLAGLPIGAALVYLTYIVIDGAVLHL